MYRRRRRTRDIPFGLDSFLDVIANVVGVIIRLILVVWVGARSYEVISRMAAAEQRPIVTEESAELEHPLLHQLTLARQELEETRSRVAAFLPKLEQSHKEGDQLKQRLAELTVQQQALERQRTASERTQRAQASSLQTLEQALAELRRRRAQLETELRALAQLPPAKNELRYRTPVSLPVRGEELHFECKAGRVAFVDIAAFVSEIRRDLSEKEKLLRSRWQVDETTSPVGSFRLRYTIERERGPLESLANSGLPDADGSFRYGLSQWVVEPLAAQRGETVEVALTPRSQFRQVIDPADLRTTVVTFWVYSDSFHVFRRLRDYLHERNIEVAARPLPEGIPIASSRHGTASRGQ